MSYYSSSTITETYERWTVASSMNYNDWGGGPSEILITWIVRRLDDGVVNYTGNDFNGMVAEGVIPFMGQSYEVFDPASVFGCWQPLARCHNIAFETLDANGRCKITASFQTLSSTDPKTITYLTPGPGGPPTPNPIKNYLPGSVEYVGTTRSSVHTRANWTVAVPSFNPPSGLVYKNTIDIGGTTIGGSKGIEVPIEQIRMRIRIVRDSRVAPMDDQQDQVDDYVGKMHYKDGSSPFWGFLEGTIICESITMNKIEGTEYYEVVFDFLHDKLNFFDQIPQEEAWGEIKTAGSDATPIDVRWERKYYQPKDFNLIFAAEPDLVAIIQNGYWIP